MEKHFRNPPTHPSQKITGAIYMMKWSTGTRNMTANLKKFTSQRRLYFSNFLFGNKVFIAARVATPCWDNFEQFRCRKFARRCGANTFATQNVKSMKASDHFLKFRCRKFARCCGQKHSKSKCTKHTMFGPVLEVQMSKICTPLWPEAHL